jgi:hypothetical protein
MGGGGGSLVNATPRPLERDSLPILQEGGWDSVTVWTGAETLPSTGFEPQTFQPLGSRYTDYAISASIHKPIRSLNRRD